MHLTNVNTNTLMLHVDNSVKYLRLYMCMCVVNYILYFLYDRPKGLDVLLKALITAK